jgi:prevent-host-death family protein
MLTVNIHEAKTNLSKLLERIARGESFVIAKAGKPVAKVSPIDAPEAKKLQRIGAMEGQFTIPDDFNTMFQEEIEDMFYNGPIFPEERAALEDDAGQRR